jgi:hypothetical protein
MTKIILTIVAGLAAATTVGVLYFSNMDTGMQAADDTQVQQEGETLTLTSNDEIKGKDSILSLLKLGKSLECTFSFSSGDMKGEGTGYFHEGSSRVDSLYTGGGEMPVASYMITDGKSNTMYSWFLANGTLSGMKMAIPSYTDDEGNAISAPQAQAANDQVNTETPVTYACKPWTVDSSVFVPPSDVEFMDMTSMQKQMEDMQKQMGGMTMPNMQ